MSAEFNKIKAMGVTGSYADSCMGKKEPLPHPHNCKTECPYGYGRAFCFPCMAKIMANHKAYKNTPPLKG